METIKFNAIIVRYNKLRYVYLIDENVSICTKMHSLFNLFLFMQRLILSKKINLQNIKRLKPHVTHESLKLYIRRSTCNCMLYLTKLLNKTF